MLFRSRPHTGGVGQICAQAKFSARRRAVPGRKRDLREIGSAQSFERRVYNDTAKRIYRGKRILSGAAQIFERTAKAYGEGKAERVFFSEAETSCNAEGRMRRKAEPWAVWSFRMMVFTGTPKARERFEPNRRTICAIQRSNCRKRRKNLVRGCKASGLMKGRKWRGGKEKEIFSRGSESLTDNRSQKG